MIYLGSESGKEQDTERNLLRAVVENAVDGIITIDQIGTILSTNPAVERIFGFTAQELLGQNVRVLMPQPYHGEHDGYLTNYRETGVRKIIGIGREVQGQRKDGSVFPLDLAVSEIKTDAGPIFTGIVRDITERKRAEEAIRRERALLKAVVDAAVDGIITIDAVGTVLTINPAVERIFGYCPDELIGQNVRMLMPSPYHEQHVDYLANYRETGIRKIIGIGREVQGKRKDGTVFPLDLAVSETLTEDGVIFTGIVRDITDRVRSAELEMAKEAADRANEAKSEFLSRMSHELRTPLNAVIGFAQLLEMRYDDPKIQTATTSILKAGQHLLNLINEVLDLARIESGRLTISLETVSLREVIDQAIELIKPLAERSLVQIKLDVDACRGIDVNADRQRVLQVFINLLSNAVKFNRPNGLVEIKCGGLEGGYRIAIRDTGFGITEQQRALLFRPFERFGDTGIEGTGLGLVLSQKFVDLMGGRLHLGDSSPAGSTFYVDLQEAQGLKRPSRSDSPNSGGVVSGTTGVVLYIEDNLSNLRLVEMLLDEWPHVTLIPAMQGQVGLELAISHHPDVILLDVHLPDIQGAEVLRRLKANEATADIPVVVITADAMPGNQRLLMESGAYGFMTKPLDVAAFLRLLESLLGS